MATGNSVLIKSGSYRLNVQGHINLTSVDIDADRDLLVFLNDGKEVFMQDLTSAEARKLPIVHSTTINCVRLAENFVVSSSNDGSSRVEELYGCEKQFKINTDMPSAAGCAISSDANLIGVIFVDYWKRISKVIIVHRTIKQIASRWTVHSTLGSIDFSPNGSLSFVSEISSQCQQESKNCLSMYETKTRRLLATTEIITRQSGPFLCKVCCDIKAHTVVILDAVSLRVWRVSEPKRPLYTLSDYRPPKTCPRNPNVTTGSCSISQDGSRIVAAIAEGCFGVWDARTLKCIATLAGHSAPLFGCSISNNGERIVTVDRDNIVNKWVMPAKPKKLSPSAMEIAFDTALGQPEKFTEEFLLQHLRAQNVKTASDLFVGHNLVLLAIRCGVITRENIRSLGGSSWYLQENLYHPATKMTQENAFIIDSIFQHAENLGIITNGYILKIARSIRTDMDKDKDRMTKEIESLAGRMVALEQRVDDLELHAVSVGSDLNNIRSALTSIAANQDDLCKHVYSLSQNLTKLQKTLKKNNKRSEYILFVKIILSLIPVAGQMLGDTACAFFHTLMDHGYSDLVSVYGDLGEAMATKAYVDLGNLHVARYAFSSRFLSKLPSSATHAIHVAISNSGFSDLHELQSMLQEEVQSMSTSDPSLAFVDIGSSRWLSGEKEHSEESAQNPSLDEKAQKYFQAVTDLQEGNSMPVEEAVVELNEYLKKCDGLAPVDTQILEDLFFKVASDDAEVVTEDVFVKMFHAVRLEQEERGAEEELKQEVANRFRKRAPSGALSLKMAARLASNIVKARVEEHKRSGSTEKPIDSLDVVKELQKYDIDASGSIDESEFIRAVQDILKTHDCTWGQRT